MRRAAIAALIATLLAGPAAAAQKPANGGYLKVWDSYPSRAERMALWPAAARAKGLGGDAAGVCRLQKDGSLADCRVLVERPAGEGFGQALLALTARARHRPPPTPDLIGDEIAIGASWPVPDVPPIWLQHFKKGDASVIYTPAAMHNPLGGASVINCMTGAQGDLYDCRILIENPPGMGYGDMAGRFTPYFKFSAARYQGKGVKSTVNIPFNFPPGPAATPAAAPKS